MAFLVNQLGLDLMLVIILRAFSVYAESSFSLGRQTQLAVCY